jgi:hypothetical protein
MNCWGGRSIQDAHRDSWDSLAGNPRRAILSKSAAADTALGFEDPPEHSVSEFSGNPCALSGLSNTVFKTCIPAASPAGIINPRRPTRPTIRSWDWWLDV